MALFLPTFVVFVVFWRSVCLYGVVQADGAGFSPGRRGGSAGSLLSCMRRLQSYTQSGPVDTRRSVFIPAALGVLLGLLAW